MQLFCLKTSQEICSFHRKAREYSRPFTLGLLLPSSLICCIPTPETWLWQSTGNILEEHSKTFHSLCFISPLLITLQFFAFCRSHIQKVELSALHSSWHTNVTDPSKVRHLLFIYVFPLFLFPFLLLHNLSNVFDVYTFYICSCKICIFCVCIYLIYINGIGL